MAFYGLIKKKKCTCLTIVVTMMLLVAYLHLGSKYFQKPIPFTKPNPDLMNDIFNQSKNVTEENFSTISLFQETTKETTKSPQPIVIVKPETRPALLVDLPYCHIPNIDPLEAFRLKLVKGPKKLWCQKYSDLAFKKNQFLHIDKKALMKLKLKIKDIKCCFRSVRRNSTGSNPDRTTVFGKQCVFFEDKVEVEEEFVRFECYNGRNATKYFYSKYFTFFVDKDTEDSDEIDDDSKLDRYNVLVLGIDSVSRLNFHRQMGKTKKFLVEELKALEMTGYISMGDNKFLNVAPMTSGQSEEELKSCYDKYKSFDNCNFVWDRFSSAGYKTLLAEDSPDISTFNYQMRGFNKQPTHYYLRPGILAAENETGHESTGNAKICVGPLSQTEYTLEYIREVFEKLKNELVFGFSWISSLTHDTIEHASNADSLYYDFFRRMKKSGTLDKTIVFFVSDHGMRWGDIVEREQGKLEERLPLCYIHLPTRFKTNHPGLVDMLDRNSKMLTSAHDIYSTLMNLINFTGRGLNSTRWFRYPNFHERSKSLFTKIPIKRTCASMDVHPLWCPCGEKENVAKKSEVVQMSANIIVNFLNEVLLSMDNKCAKLRLYKIVNAWSITHMEAHIQGHEKKNKNMQVYSVEVMTRPGGGLFEAALETDGDKFEIINEVVRNNMYANQSHCVQEKFQKTYCYCKDLLQKSSKNI